MASTEAWRQLYPFASHQVALGAHRYHYLDEGAGETLLLVHGNPTWSFYWHPLLTALRGQYRLIVPDHMGCGLSDKPRTYPYCLQQHTRNLQALIDSLGLDRITLLAHDWGGAIGLSAAVADPDRFTRLVLFNTAAFRAPMPWRIRVCRIPGLGKLAVQGCNAFARAALYMAVEQPLDASVKAGLLAPYDSWTHRVAIQRFVQDIPMKPSHPSYAALVQLEQGLALLRSKPTALIWGMRDWCFTPECLGRIQHYFPQAETHRLEQAGHYVVLDAKQQVIPLVQEFLQAHPA